MYYYAMLSRKDVVTSVYALLSPLPESRYMVEISKALYEDKGLIGKKYDRDSESFMFWACSTDNVQYRNTTESLSEKLESMDSAISESKADVSSLNSDIASAITQIAETAAVADNASAGVDRLDSDLASLRNEVGGVEDSVGSVSFRVGQLEADYTETKAKTEEVLKDVDTDIKALKSDTAANAGEIRKANATIAGVQETAENNSVAIGRTDVQIQLIKDRMNSISNIVGENQKSIENLVAATSGNAADIQALETASTQQSAEITRIDQNVDAVIHAVNDHESVINSLDAQVDTLTEATNDNTVAIQAVEGSIDSLTRKSNNNSVAIENLRIDFERTSENLREDLDSASSLAQSVNSGLTTFKKETAENFAEAQSAVNDLDGRVSANAGDIAALIGSVKKAETNISNLVSSVNSVAADVDTVEKAVDTVESQISAIQTVNTQQDSKISSVESKANTATTNITNLTKRVTTAEGNIANLTKRVTTVEGNISTLQSDVATAKTNITSVTNKANTNASNITTVTNKANTNASNITAVTSRVTTAEKNISTANSNISKLTTRVTTAESAIDAVEADVATIEANKVLQLTNANGQPKYMFKEGEDLLQGLIDLPVGATTAYANNGAVGVPKSNEQWRLMIHKTNAEILWVIAFGSVGSIYTNYYNTPTYGWQGWKCVYNALPEALWKGGQYPNSGANIVPTKKLSECRTGWILMWSDYDVSTKAVNDYDFCTSVIYKCKPDGSKWNGESFNFSIPNYVASDVASDSRIMKKLKIYDNKIVGYDENSTGTRNDVVLRAVMEF